MGEPAFQTGLKHAFAFAAVSGQHILGPATTAERERANDDDEYNEMLKKKYFIHINIAPYGEIPEETKENDRILTRFLYRVEQ